MGENEIQTTQYLTFKLKDEVFGADISEILEILDFIKVTKIPQTPDFMLGVTNLRGKAIPVIDMRLKLGMDKAEVTVNSSIIVMEIQMEGEVITLGTLVDAVCEVIDIDSASIEPAPKIGTKLNTEFIKGIGKKDESFIILLNIDKVFSFEELLQVQKLEESSSLQEQ